MTQIPPALPPDRRSIEGRYADLRPLDALAHWSDLRDDINGPANDWLWTYTPDGPFQSRELFIADLERKSRLNDPLYFAIIDRDRNRVGGYAAFLRIEPRQACLEIGSILFTPGLQRTRGGTEAIYLMLRYAFDELGVRRCEWKCDSLNAASRRAAERFGFTFEGMFRQHMIVKGRNRDTAWYSLLDVQWTGRKAALETWLDPRNFAPDGTQRSSLARSAVDSPLTR